MNPPPQRRRLFLSYSHKDKGWAYQLRRIFLNQASDTEILNLEDHGGEPRGSWQEQIEKDLATAEVAVVLVSADYLSSDFLWNGELSMIQAAAKRGLVIGWFLLTPCAWEETPIASWQALFPPTQALASLDLEKQQRALQQIAASIAKILRQTSPPASQPDKQVIRWWIRQRFFRENLEPGVDLTMAWIPAGTFQMRAPESENGSLDQERPTHLVSCGEFLLAEALITQEQWRVVAGFARAERDLDPAPWRQKGESLPVDSVSWEDAVEFCQRLAAHTGRYYELPTVAQWEYACRAGSRGAYHWGDSFSPELASGTTANVWGLRQMHGNLWEWCLDPWHDTYRSAPTNEWPWLDGSEDVVMAEHHVLRGGSFADPDQRCRSASRISSAVGVAREYIGLRVCCLPVGTPYLRLFASRPQWRAAVSRSQCEHIFGRPLTGTQYDDLQHCLQRFRILTVTRIRMFLCMVGLVTGGLQNLLQEPAFSEEQEVEGRSAEGRSDDLLRFRGAGALAIAGRSDYQELADSLSDPKVMEGAEYVAKRYPFASAGFILEKRTMNALLDAATDPRVIFSALPGPSFQGPSDPRLKTLGRFQRRAAEALPDPR